jgi:hypothetical protein
MVKVFVSKLSRKVFYQSAVHAFLLAGKRVFKGGKMVDTDRQRVVITHQSPIS